MKLTESLRLLSGPIWSIDGKLCIDRKVLMSFLVAAHDPLPEFEGPANSELGSGGRGLDHPRFGRFVYALACYYRPEHIVEVGTFAGGTAVGFARALLRNGRGRLICIDRDSYANGTFPEVVERNLARVGLPASRFELCGGDSKQWLPKLLDRLGARVDILLVDGDHTYEGALADLRNAIPLVRPGGLILVHDVDRDRQMVEAAAEHPHPVHEAFHRVVADHGLEWCILKFIRKHLGILRIGGCAPAPELPG